MHTYIGTSICASNQFDISDPSINAISCILLGIDGLNKDFVSVSKVINGIYHSYHSLDDKTSEIKDLLYIHDSYSISDLDDYLEESIGIACTTFGSSVSICDQRYRFDSSYCYFMIEKDAYYDATAILSHLPEMGYSNHVQMKLKTLCLNCKGKDTHPTGEDIVACTDLEPIWPGFKSAKVYSSHWSEDVMRRINHLPAAVFMGGVVSRSEKGMLPCYCYRNYRGQVFAVRVSLEHDVDAFGKLDQ